MRITVSCVVLTLCVIACTATSTPTSTPKLNRGAPPVEITISIAPDMRERFASGLAIDVELRTQDERVGRCTLSFDLWEEHYRVAFSQTHVEQARDLDTAALMCVDRDAVQHVVKGNRTATVEVREAPNEQPLHTPPRSEEF